jgi:hypothetical protein
VGKLNRVGDFPPLGQGVTKAIVVTMLNVWSLSPYTLTTDKSFNIDTLLMLVSFGIKFDGSTFSASTPFILDKCYADCFFFN